MQAEELLRTKTPQADPLEGEEPYPLRPYAKSFTEAVEIADALIEGTDQGEVVWDFTGE